MMEKGNHAVGEVYKAGEFVDLHRDLNIHDPHEKYVWADDDLPWWARALYGVAFLGLIASIVVFGLLL